MRSVSRSTTSRNHSAIDGRKVSASSPTYNKMHKPEFVGKNALSSRDSSSKLRKVANGSGGKPFQVQLSGQGLPIKGTSGSSKAHSRSSSVTGGSGPHKKKSRNLKSVTRSGGADIKTSTHSLKIQMTKQNKKPVDDTS